MVLSNDSGLRKTCLVHRLVAQAFIPNIDNKSTVNHINSIRCDNKVSNLEWATPKEQQAAIVRSGSGGRKTPIQQLSLDSNLIHVHSSIKQACQALGVPRTPSTSAIVRVAMGKSHSARGFIWRYSNDTLPDEEWRDASYVGIAGHAGVSISDTGRLRYATGHIVTGNLESKHYPSVRLGGKRYYMHVLVCKAFVPLVEGKNIVHHINHNKIDARACNLQWVNPSENVTLWHVHHSNSKPTTSDVTAGTSPEMQQFFRTW